jgi:hypothetical protein
MSIAPPRGRAPQRAWADRDKRYFAACSAKLASKFKLTRKQKSLSDSEKARARSYLYWTGTKHHSIDSTNFYAYKYFKDILQNNNNNKNTKPTLRNQKKTKVSQVE